MRCVAAVTALCPTLGPLPAAAQPTPEPAPAPGVFVPTTPWQDAVLQFAGANFNHPSWGYRHAERNYPLARQLAHAENMAIDDEVLFAAALLHDWGGLEPFEVEGTPHQLRSIELAEPFLRDAGFPMEKWPAVRDAILGHVPSGQPTMPEGIVLRDADLLDFLGAEGIARLLAATGDEPSMDRSLSWIEGFSTSLPDRLITAEARRLAEPRVAYMIEFLNRLRSELPPATQP